VRSIEDIQGFKDSLSRKLAKSCEHAGPLPAQRTLSARDSMCSCKKEWLIQSKAFEACVPRKFWNSTARDIFHNGPVYNGVIVKFQENLSTAFDTGAGLFLHGPNGCGKTMFLSMLMMYCIRNTKLSCYYTTALQLDHDIKSTFGNSKAAEERGRRIERMVKSRIFVLDELGKERFKGGDSYTRTKLELFLRNREEEKFPILIASNKTPKSLRQSVEDGGYGETFGSIIDGSCLAVPMLPGDQRARQGKELRKKMGY